MSVDHQLGGYGVAVPEVASVPATRTAQAAPADPEAVRARRLVLSAVLRGLILDDPWRHDYLRNRWFGI